LCKKAIETGTFTETEAQRREMEFGGLESDDVAFAKDEGERRSNITQRLHPDQKNFQPKRARHYGEDLDPYLALATVPGECLKWLVF
jgi:hypothetical protein